ncbi:glycosyltransferase, partial [Candidatus Falkowbacteria bacterium]|nr:glycosyltransferase [Candidatus Falkowbacteria bacterium]
MRKIGIIIVNYKDYAEKFLSECKNSLDNQTFPKDQFQVYIVDNASTESSLNYLESHFKDAKVLPRPDGNFSAANNLGAQKAIEDECEIIIALNMDVVLDEDWLKNLVEQVESNKEGIYQSKMLLHSNKELVNSEGNLFHYLGFGFTDGYNKLNDKDESEIKELK